MGSTEDFQDCETALCDAVLVDAFPYSCVQEGTTPRVTPNTSCGLDDSEESGQVPRL